MQGWISLHRKILEHPLFLQSRSFSKFEAWIDMLLLANHKDNKVLLGSEIILVKRGSFITSELKLMNRWKWSKTKLRQYLNLLETESMIKKKADKKKTTITICSYDVYQTTATTKKPQSNYQSDTNNNEENVLQEIYTHWNLCEIIVHRSITEKMKRHLNARLKEYEKAEIISAINNYRQVLSGSSYYWTHKWTFQDFLLPNNLVRFMNESDPLSVFQQKNNKNQTLNEEEFDLDE